MAGFGCPRVAGFGCPLTVANHVLANSKRTNDQKMADEFSCIKLLGKRSIAGVITTNYDQMAEDLLDGFQ